MLLQAVFKQARNYELFEIDWVVADKQPIKILRNLINSKFSSLRGTK